MNDKVDSDACVNELINLFGITINNKNMSSAISWIVEHGKKSNKTNIAFVNTDCLNKVNENPQYRECLDGFDQIYADGIGIKIGCKLRKKLVVDNVNGTDMFPLICEAAISNGLKIFLLGGEEGIAKQCASNMCDSYQGLQIVGTQHGFYNKDETDEVISKINSSDTDILIVGLGAPAQELWIAKHSTKLNPSVRIGVGGLFDFYSGRIPRAPVWMRESGLEWVWRLMQEPGRMWQRYIVGNPLYLFHAIKFSLNYLKSESIGLYDDSKFNDSLLDRYSAIHKYRNVYLMLSEFKKFSLFLMEFMFVVSKRLLDIIGSMTALLLLSPILMLVALLIKVESPGPIFFSQMRSGLNGDLFKMWKFRSMYLNAEEIKKELEEMNEMKGGVTFKVKDDPRITVVGKIIRKSSIDELPQLWNVLIGDMSLVGPRPALPAEVAHYSLADRYRLKVTPGITCIWQVSGRSNIPFDEQVLLDVKYINSRSLLKDLWLLISTIPAVITARGAY